MLPGINLQMKLTKAGPSFYIMIKTAESKIIFKFLDAYLLVRRLHPNPATLSAQTLAHGKWIFARYNIMKVDLKTFTFSVTSKSLSIDNAVLGPIL